MPRPRSHQAHVGKNLELLHKLIKLEADEGEVKDEDCQWPRVVRPILKRHHHAICRLCTQYGDLREIIFTPNKHGKILYKCAKTTNWGDRLPVILAPLPEKDSNTHQKDGQPENIDHQPKPD